jgi:ABC-type phosphate/phosphonate transport system substrate-binding protein
MSCAGLPMYDLEELRWAHDAWWRALARGFREAGIPESPASLDRGKSHHELWSAPDLRFGQACGYPLTHEFAGRLALVATPCYRAPGCEGTSYRSWILVRDGSEIARIAGLAGTRAAINDRNSQSGCNALKALVAPLAKGGRFFASVTVTGNHVASIASVREGRADVAAIDCVTYALLAEHRPAALFGTRVVAAGPAAPALPYVASATADAALLERLRAGLRAAFADPASAAARRALLIEGAEVLPLSAYDVILEQERAATALGYPELA